MEVAESIYYYYLVVRKVTQIYVIILNYKFSIPDT